MKDAIGVVAAVLVFAAYVPYIRDILRGKTHPHIYSWLLWGILTIAIFGIQISHHAGPGSFVTIAAGIMSFVVLGLSFKKGKRNIVFADKVVFVLTMLTMIFWLLAKQPLLAILLACLADLLAFIPTVRKSWHQPFTETLSLYELNSVRFGLAIIALSQYTLITVIWPAMWAIGNGLFAIMLISRRKNLTS